MSYIAIGSVIVSVVGGAVTQAGNKKSAQATQNVWNQFRQRTQQRENEAASVWSRNLKNSGADTANAEMAQGEQKRLAGYNRMGATSVPSAVPGVMSAPRIGNRVIATPTAASRASVKNAGSAWSKLLGGAQAKLGGVQQWQMNQQVRDNNTDRSLNQITREAKGDLANVVPAQLTAAGRKGDAMQGWGSMLSSIGKLGGMAAGMGGGAASGAGSVTASGMAPAAGTPMADALNAGGGSMFASMFPK